MTSTRREAFIAFIAPIGIDMDEVTRVISEKATQVAYSPNPIKLTDYLKAFERVPKTFDNEVHRYKAYIKAGDQLCSDAERGDILALLGITKMLQSDPDERDKLALSPRLNIFRQIKRLDEYRTLDRVYGRNIIFLGCYAPKQSRVNYLVDRMRESDRKSTQTKLESQALEIISTDEDETEETYGQKIIDCYPKSDFVLDCTSLKTLEASCDRFFRIYFGDPFVSPSKDEYCSYIANAAAYRSLDLSRQVGAAIFTDEGEVISMGCNEVPAPGGGTYWEHHHNDARDFVLGYDSNQRVKEDLARDALAQLKDSGWLQPSIAAKDLQTLSKEALQEEDSAKSQKRGPFSHSMMTDIIEYGRMVHAEMNAITDAARFNRSTKKATLYCTTMPCHMCTKLVIAAGIKRVVYVQPYVKSLSGELYKDSVVFEGSTDDFRVNFESLKGVTPLGFKRAFARASKRKADDGSALKWNKLEATPNFLTSIPYYVHSERDLLAELSCSPVKEIADAFSAATKSSDTKSKAS